MRNERWKVAISVAYEVPLVVVEGALRRALQVARPESVSESAREREREREKEQVSLAERVAPSWRVNARWADDKWPARNQRVCVGAEESAKWRLEQRAAGKCNKRLARTRPLSARFERASHAVRHLSLGALHSAQCTVHSAVQSSHSEQSKLQTALCSIYSVEWALHLPPGASTWCASCAAPPHKPPH